MIVASRGIHTLYRHRDLLWIWTVREIKVRYKQSILGGAWAILQPLSLMLIFTVVFSFFVKIPTDGLPYPIFAYSALLPWTLLASSITFGVPSLVNNMNLLTKIYFPREVLPMAAIGAAVLDFILGLAVFLLLLMVYRLPLYSTLVWVPVILLVEILLVAGITLFAAAANVFYRDIRFVIPLALQLWFYASPVIYPLSVVPAWLRPLYMLNPMAGIIDSYRRVMLMGQPPSPVYLGTSLIVTLALTVFGYGYFKNVESQFADLI